MDNLPVELILAIARFFDGPAFVTSLQVCSRWHLILHPLIWRLIQKSTLDNTRFPLCDMERADPTKVTSLLNDSKLVAALPHVQTLEWCTIHVARDGKQPPRWLLSAINLVTMGRIVGPTSNLVRLYLESVREGKKFGSVPLFVGYLLDCRV